VGKNVSDYTEQMVEARLDRGALLMIFLTSSSEEEMSTAFRKERLMKVADQAKDHFSTVEILTAKIENLDSITLPTSGWIFLLKPGEIPHPTLIEVAAVALDGYDAIWGGALIQNEETQGFEHVEGSRFGCSELPKIIFRDPETWLDTSFFVRAERVKSGQAGLLLDVTYCLDLWADGRGIKLGNPFVIQQLIPKYDELRDKILNYFRQNSIVKRFTFDNENLAFRIAYWNPYMESILVSGHVFEDTQLLALKKIISPGATVVDVGANIGQHTIFFAKNLKAKKVIPIEPNPNFAEIIRENVALNDIENVDFSLLGYGVGDKEGKCRIVESGISPQDTIVEYDQSGEIPISPLDRLIKEDVHLVKIDVDESELEVLRGMVEILETMRPILAIEVVHQNLSSFLSIMESFDYRIDHVFSNPQYNDIVAVPRK
jgi:FkbM family methyltransferase